MCPPAFDPSADMVFNGSDEQAITYLERLRDNYPLPNHVIDLNPYEPKPYNLPGGMWYLVCSTAKKRNEFGFWRQKESASEISTNSAISVWRATLEFIEIQDAQEKRTDWVMHEYKITEKGPCSDKIEKESRAICRVFLSDSKNSSLEVQPNTRETPISAASVVPRIETVNNGIDTGLLVSESDRQLNPQTRDTVEQHHSELGDYLELDDLAAPLSLSNSYGNSSRSIFTSVDDEYFDSEALLRELDSENNQRLQAILDSENNQSLQAILDSENNQTLKPGEQEKKGDASCSSGVASSSSSSSSSNGGQLEPKGKRKATGKLKGIKKCFCFSPE